VVGCREIVNHREMRALKIRELRSPQAFTVRRSQTLLASNAGHTAPQIAAQLHCSDQCVREAVHAFHTEGLSCLSAKSHATHTDQSAIDETGRDRLEELLHQSPRHFGQDTSVWTLKGLAQVGYAQGITSRQVSTETIRRTLKKLGENWKRAKKRLRSASAALTRSMR